MVNGIINPVMMKVYSEGGSGEMPDMSGSGGMPDMGNSGDPGPTLDEVD